MSLAERLFANAQAVASIARSNRSIPASSLKALAEDLQAGAHEALTLELRIHLDQPRPPAPTPRRIKARERR